MTTVSITINLQNQAPVAAADAYAVTQGGTLSPVAPGVLANDTDAEGGTLTAEKVSNPLHGTVVLSASGAFTYTHDGSLSGSDSFTYRASDGSLSSNVTTVSITVSTQNRAPVAVADAMATSEDTPTTIAVLDNDSDMDGDALVVTAVSNPTHGSAALNQDSTVRYAPDANYSGFDTFFYTLSDGRGGTDTGRVTVTVGAVNDAPTAAPDAYGTPRNVTLNTPAPGVLANDGDLEGAHLTAVLVTGPAHGTLAFHANGSFTYVPAADYYGADSFTYQANDAALDSNLGTVYLSVRSLSGAPLAAADVYTAALNGTLAIAAPGVLGNDSDVDGHALSAVLVGGAAHGTVALSADGSFVYTPDAGWSGVDSFAYKASDGELDSIAATATLTVGVFAVGDGDMFLAKMTCSLNWARHAAGVAADTLTIAGISNPRGCALDLTGASAVLRVNGVRLSPVMTLDAHGSASRLSGSLTYSFRFDRKRGSYSLDLKGLDLRAVLGLSRPLATVLHESPVPVMLDLTIAGAGLEVPLVVGTFECPLATTAGKTSRLTFETRSDCTLTGVFQCCLAGASQKTGAVYSLATRGVIEAAGGGAVVPTGDITVTIGQATLVIPFAQVVDHGTAWSYAGTSPGITAFSLHNDTHNFALSASRVAGTGIPLSATDAPTAHGLYVQLRVPTAAGVMVFDSTVELLRPSGRQLTWRR